MNARPTILSTILGLIALALTGPMSLLAVVDDENCPRPGTTEPRACYELLADDEFWQKVVASGVGSVAEPWASLTALLLPMFGIPAFMNVVQSQKRKAQPPEPENTE